MAKINLLSQETIDKIAAGEVVERPSSIVKELVENSIDAGATAVTVEIQGGGISLIRITDNGEGIEPAQIPTAFLRHATSKINQVEDLDSIASFGFRGEALSSICAVSQMELITKCPGQLTGIRYRIEGGQELSSEEIGAPDGSTFLVRNLFYNTPVRRKFLKSQTTEAGYVTDRIEQLALSHPEIAFKYIVNGTTKLHTSGNGRLKDVIYNLYGREITENLLEIDCSNEWMHLYGYIAKPHVSRGNRTHEHYFVNGRYVRNSIISKAIEDGYKNFLMQHRYPFTILSLEMDGTQVDVNVHPSKLEVRFTDGPMVFQSVHGWIFQTLTQQELITKVKPQTEKEVIKEQKKEESLNKQQKSAAPEPFENIRRSYFAETKSPYEPKYQRISGYGAPEKKQDEGTPIKDLMKLGTSHAKETVLPEIGTKAAKPSLSVDIDTEKSHEKELPPETAVITDNLHEQVTVKQDTPQEKQVLPKAEQMELFDDHFLSKKNVKEHRIIGQLFDTYWLIEYRNNLYIIDQHAAHEKVMYERFCKAYQNKEMTSQQISPPIVVHLNLQEENIYQTYEHYFTDAGFEIEPFGGRAYAISAVPDNLYGFSDELLFTQMLDSLSDATGKPDMMFLYERLATMACKAAVKGNHRMAYKEMEALIDELLGLDNPYNCPHGRPTIISMSKYEIEKKFKRII